MFDQLGRGAPIEWKRMFGRVGLYGQDVFALIDDDVVYFKAGDQNRSDVEADRARPFKPFERRFDELLRVPVEVLEDAEALRAWTQKAVTVAQSARRATDQIGHDDAQNGHPVRADQPSGNAGVEDGSLRVRV